MTLSLDTAYRSFGGEVEASSTPTICRLPDSRRHQLWAIARCYLAGTAKRPGFLPAGSRHSGAATAQHAILGGRDELAGHSPYGNRCNSVGVGGPVSSLGHPRAAA